LKSNWIVYASAGVSIVFVGAMAYLYFGTSQGGPGSAASVLDQTPLERSLLADRGKTVSGKAGKLAIAYAGDYDGSLEPCG
jgi:hypothetical protein